MIQRIALLGCLFPFALIGQTWKFMEEAKAITNVKDSTYEIEEVTAGSTAYEFLEDGMDPLEALCLAELKDLSKNKPDVLKCSATLNALANLATKFWKGSHYSDAKKWGNMHKYFRRASDNTTSNFNIMQEYSFRIPLVNKSGNKYYYDPKGEHGGLNLYKGKKPKTKQEREENEQVPLELFTEEQLVELFMQNIRRKRLYGDFKRGGIAFVGLSIELDENTIHKTKIPTARVVLLVGARKMRDVPGKYQLPAQESL